MATENQPKVEEKKVETPVEQPKAKVETPKPKVDDDEEFINSLLEDVDTDKKEELTEEQKRQKNKDAEEARKRRAAEVKAKADEEAAKQAELQAKVVATEPAKPEVKQEPAKQDVNKLGEELVDFKSKYPDVDLLTLDSDKSFKRFIDGKLLGKKNFTILYEEYVELKSEITGVEQKVIRTNYQKAQSSSGSSVSPVANRGEVFSEEELRKVASRLPTMNPREAAKIEEKLKKSIAYYDSKK